MPLCIHCKCMQFSLVSKKYSRTIYYVKDFYKCFLFKDRDQNKCHSWPSLRNKWFLRWYNGENAFQCPKIIKDTGWCRIEGKRLYNLFSLEYDHLSYFYYNHIDNVPKVFNFSLVLLRRTCMFTCVCACWVYERFFTVHFYCHFDHNFLAVNCCYGY